MEPRTEVRLLLVLLVAATAIILWGLSRGRNPDIDSASYAPRPRAEPMAPALSPSDHGAMRQSLLPIEEPIENRSEQASARPVVLHGRVVEEETGVPCDHAEIRISSNPEGFSRQDHAEKPPHLEATTDGDGDFQLALSPAEDWRLGQLHLARVVSLGGEETLFYGSVILAEGMVLLVRHAKTLRGRVRAGWDIGSQGSVTLLLPSRGHVPVFGGSAKLSVDGSFSIVTRTGALPETVLLRFGFDGLTLEREVLSSDLLATEGATIDLRLTTLRLQVSDGSDPIEGVTMTVGLPDRATVVATVHSGRDGVAEVRTPPGTVAICLSKPGYVTRVDTARMESDSQLRSFVLEKLRTEHRVFGTVLGPMGEPIEDALVTAMPTSRNEELGIPAAVQARTDRSGVFALEVGGEIDLVAFRKDFGATPKVSLTAAGQRVILRFDANGRVSLRLDCSGLSLPVRAGQAEYFLVDRFRERVIGGRSLAPLEIHDVPASSYNLFVFLPDSDLYGQCVATVLSGEMCSTDVLLAPAIHARGVVVDHSGRPVRGARLRIERKLWPPEIEAAWGTAETAGQGAFDLLAGDITEATLAIERGSLRQRLMVDCRSPIRLTLETGGTK